MIHKPLSPDGVHPQSEIVSPLPCSSGLVRHISHVKTRACLGKHNSSAP